MRVEVLNPDSFNDSEFIEWLGEVQPEWFRDYLSPTPKTRQLYFENRFLPLLDKSDSTVFLATIQDRPVAVLGLE